MPNYIAQTVTECVGKLDLKSDKVGAAITIRNSIDDTLARAALEAADILVEHGGQKITLELVNRVKDAILTLGANTNVAENG